MFAYILGPLLFGWYGLFLGPVVLVLGVHFARLVLPELLHSERLQPYAVDPTYFEGEAGPQSTTVGNATPEADSPVDGAPVNVVDVTADDGADPVPDGSGDD